MPLLAWLSRTLRYIRLKFYFLQKDLPINLFLYLRRRSRPELWANVSKLSISAPSGRGRLAIYLHTPPTDGITKGPKPVHINIHGGGFCFPLHGVDVRFCALVAREAGCYVVDADYRAAPDHPWPAPYDDVRRVLAWVRANEGGLFDTGRITIGGFSAGANLSLAVVGCDEEQEGEGGIDVKGVVAFYPSVDFTVPYAEKTAPPVKTLEGRDRGIVIPLKEGELFRDAYTLNIPRPHTREQMQDPRLSPRFASAAKFPGGGRTFILACEYDYLGPEGREWAKELEEAGREPVSVWVEGLGHGWDGMCSDGTEGARVRDEMWAKAVEVIKKAQTA